MIYWIVRLLYFVIRVVAYLVETDLDWCLHLCVCIYAEIKTHKKSYSEFREVYVTKRERIDYYLKEKGLYVLVSPEFPKI